MKLHLSSHLHGSEKIITNISIFCDLILYGILPSPQMILMTSLALVPLCAVCSRCHPLCV